MSDRRGHDWIRVQVDTYSHKWYFEPTWRERIPTLIVEPHTERCSVVCERLVPWQFADGITLSRWGAHARNLYGEGESEPSRDTIKIIVPGCRMSWNDRESKYRPFMDALTRATGVKIVNEGGLERYTELRSGIDDVMPVMEASWNSCWYALRDVAHVMRRVPRPKCRRRGQRGTQQGRCGRRVTARKAVRLGRMDSFWQKHWTLCDLHWDEQERDREAWEKKAEERQQRANVKTLKDRLRVVRKVLKASDQDDRDEAFQLGRETLEAWNQEDQA